jgi:hypothetical protein
MRISVDDFRGDPMFRRVERVVADLLARGNVVTPVQLQDMPSVSQVAAIRTEAVGHAAV